MARIYVCGEAIVDFVQILTPEGPAYRPLPGGSPFNIAKAAASAGADAVFLGALSTDLFGDLLLRDLDTYGVDTSLVPRAKDPSTLAFVDTSSGAPRYAFFDRQSVSTQLAPQTQQIAPQAGDILCIGSISLIPQPAADNIVAFAQTMSTDMMVALDPNVRANMIHDRAPWEARINTLFDLSTLVKISAEDLAYLNPQQDKADFARDLIDRGVALVIVTDGAKGALGMTASAHCVAQSPQVDVIDTVGAGDTFMGNVLAGLHRAGCTDAESIRGLTENDLAHILLCAGQAAAINCTRTGCQPPRLTETIGAMKIPT